MSTIDSYEEMLSDITVLAHRTVALCSEKHIRISTAESCTGGMISSAITSISGSSEAIELGVCAYSNRIKREVLSVSEQTLSQHTEYSAECAEEMASGVIKLGGADYGVSTTGVAGPSGGSSEHPVGEVFIAVCAADGKKTSLRCVFPAKTGKCYTARDYIRTAAAKRALQLLIDSIEGG